MTNLKNPMTPKIQIDIGKVTDIHMHTHGHAGLINTERLKQRMPKERQITY